MRLIVRCPQCGSGSRLPAEGADRRVRCRHCGRLFRTPRLDEISVAAETLKRAKGTVYVDQEGKIYG